MLRIFDSNADGMSWGERINFVDDSNVLVGFDMSQSCCEDFGWSITPDLKGEGLDYGGVGGTLDYTFDPSFYSYDELQYSYDNGGAITFRLISDEGDEDLYLHLWNHHNGYYSHGFNFQIGEGDDRIMIESGSL